MREGQAQAWCQGAGESGSLFAGSSAALHVAHSGAWELIRRECRSPRPSAPGLQGPSPAALPESPSFQDEHHPPCLPMALAASCPGSKPL